ncbi:MAG TPA: HEAT repeat domain-containing protein [Deferrisomatales bacterium]|nr:HEAT repeat domain-containing protein [Deferrisomatales bacterium]
MRVPAVFLSQLWGLLCGGALGAVRTRQAATHLLAKNHLLEAAGLPHLPGAGHWEVLSSSAPAWAGAVFFGLSLGLGVGSLCAVWCRVTRRIPGPGGRWLPRLVLALPLPALAAGDPALAGCLFAIAGGSLALHRAAQPPRPLVWRLVLLAICAGGLIPWALAPEGPFTRLRDQVLFTNAVGLAVDQFYYRWTLYPAEVLKPLAARTQPLAAVSPELPGPQRRRWCNEVRRLGVLCVDATGAAAGGVDLTVAPDAGAVVLVSGTTRLPWPQGAADQQQTWQQLSTARDVNRALRRATGLALFVGCPLGLCWLLTSVALRLACVFPSELRRRLAAAVLTAVVTAGLGAAGRADPAVVTLRDRLVEAPPATAEDLGQRLRSPRVVERFYAARAGRHLGSAGEAPLLEALSDPVINVRYAAAQALGEVGGTAARTTLNELLAQPEEWYVKERAYASLRRIGWPPP